MNNSSFSAPAPAQSRRNGQTAGVIGMVCAFLCLGPIGLVFSIISYIQLAKIDAPKTLSTLGIVFNLISIAVALFFAAMIYYTWR